VSVHYVIDVCRSELEYIRQAFNDHLFRFYKTDDTPGTWNSYVNKNLANIKQMITLGMFNKVTPSIVTYVKNAARIIHHTDFRSRFGLFGSFSFVLL